ncbi:MAG: DNA alkylation repair protein [Ruminococcus sp.]|nr:DNA alkylation repair protein [Ruminococcus sp.]
MSISEYIKSALMELKDDEFAVFTQKTIPNIDKKCFIGVRTPDLRKLAKKLVKRDDTGEFLAALPHRFFEEYQLHSFIISEVRDFDECIRLTDAFLPYIDNWATCDQLSPKVLGRYKDELLPYIDKWLGSEHTYTVRFAICSLMRFYLGPDLKVEYPDRIALIRSDEYYINMMRAWYFATALAKNYDEIVPYIEDKRLDVWTHNKTIQKAVESFRITDEQKQYLRTLKIKGA